MNIENTILNSPYDAPLLRNAKDDDASLNFQYIRQGSRVFTADIQIMPTRESCWLHMINSVMDKYKFIDGITWRSPALYEIR